jgi:hypothetical protein
MSGVVSFATKAFSGKTLKAARRFKKSVKAGSPSDASANKFAKKTVRAAKAQQNFVRGTAAAAVGGGAYIAADKQDGSKKSVKKENSIVPDDY